MKTPYLDSHLESLKKLDENKKISEHGKGLLIELTEIKKQLTIHSVVSSFFTASDVGKEFEILANTSGHGFHIGEIVTLLETNADPDDDEYKFAGKDDYWWCNFADIKTK
jgi:hypothetical protein